MDYIELQEEIQKYYPKVDLLISSFKKVFLKAPSRVELFRNLAPNLSLPPQPIITRWGTSLCAATYYSENFKILQNVIEKLDAEESVCVRIAQECFRDINIEDDLAYIKANFQIISTIITKLEKRGESLNSTINYIDTVHDVLKSSQGFIGNAVYSKFIKVF